jgi:hypothetical protein
MVTFRNNNNRRNSFRRNSRSFKSNVDRAKFSTSFTNNENFQRKSPGRNNHNASKLIEKYNNLAREALSSGDKILSENYFQHADHFTRIQVENDNYKRNKLSQTEESVTSSDEKPNIIRDKDNKENFSEKENVKVDKILKEAN